MEYHVLIYDVNSREIKPYNIFNNVHFDKDTKEAVKEFKKGKIKKEEYYEKIRRAAMYAFWAKCEYELMMGDVLEENIKKYRKIDVFKQIEANIELIGECLLKE